jgi:hypothetical protein
VSQLSSCLVADFTHQPCLQLSNQTKQASCGLYSLLSYPGNTDDSGRPRGALGELLSCNVPGTNARKLNGNLPWKVWLARRNWARLSTRAHLQPVPGQAVGQSEFPRSVADLHVHSQVIPVSALQFRSRKTLRGRASEGHFPLSLAREYAPARAQSINSRSQHGR